MENQNFLSISLALIPFFIGVAGVLAKISFSNLKTLSLGAISIVGVFLVIFVDINPPTNFLACAVLIAGFCVLISQDRSQQTSEFGSSSMITLGLTLGTLLGQGFVGRFFLCLFLGYAAFSIAQEMRRSFRKTLTLIHFLFAIVLSLSSAMGSDSVKLLSGLFLAVTFLPLVPFHLPFVGMVENAKGALSSLWMVVWLAIGLAELNLIYPSLATDSLFYVGFLALITAFYAAMAALGQKKANLFIAAATVAHVSVIWGLLNIFPNFPKWGIAFGVAVAFILGGINLAFSFVRMRYGWQSIGKLPGLATPMPRFGTVMVLLVGLALFLPMVPTFTGLSGMPTIETVDINFIKIFLIFLAVWLGGGWFFMQMLHQTAFGETRTDVPYSDLRLTEFTAVIILILGAGYSGILY